MRLLLAAASLATAIVMATITAKAADATAAPPDVVRLKDGGMVRGTIVEVVPNGTVTITLTDGETRKYPMSDALYAGPASGDGHPAADTAPTGDAPYASVHAERAKLSLVGVQENLTFHLQTASANAMGAKAVASAYSRLCTAPCGIEVPEGTQRFALSRPDGDIIAADKDLVVRGTQTIQGDIVDRHGIRLAGILTLTIGTPLGLGAVILGVVLASNPQSAAPAPLYVAGSVVAGVSAISGIVLTTRRDYVTLDVQPGVAITSAPGSIGWRPEATAGAQGLTATVRF